MFIAPLDYIAGMKAKTARVQDVKDIASIIKLLDETDVIHFTERLKRLSFEGIDESVLLEAFGEAYGMDWLEQYYINHENDFLH